MRALRSIALAAAALLLSPCAALSQASQSWPNRPVTMLVPLPAGGIAGVLRSRAAASEAALAIGDLAPGASLPIG